MLCYRSTADHAAAVAALEDLQQRGVAADRYAYNAAIRVCADAAADDEALRLLGALRSAAAAEREAAAGQPEQAGRRRGASGGAWRSQGSGWGALQPDCRSYSAALAAVAAAGRPRRALRLQQWMEEDGVEPDERLCTQFLSCYAAAGQAGAAQQLFDSLAAGAGRAGGVGAVAARLALCRAGRGGMHAALLGQPVAWVRAHLHVPAAMLRPPPRLAPHPRPSPLLLQPARRRPTAPTGMRCCWRMRRLGMRRAAPRRTGA